MKNQPLLTLIGFGPGNGFGIAKAFGAAGYRLALFSRGPATTRELVESLNRSGTAAHAFSADAGDPDSLRTALEAARSKLGETDVLVYNAVSQSFGRPTSMTPASLTADLLVNVVGALTATLAVIPSMKLRKSGVILFTGGGWALYPAVEAASGSLGKAALRNLAFTLSEELKDSGIRVGIVTIMGTVEAGTPFAPDKIGRAFVAYAEQPAQQFRPELMFEGNA